MKRVKRAQSGTKRWVAYISRSIDSSMEEQPSLIMRRYKFDSYSMHERNMAWSRIRPNNDDSERQPHICILTVASSYRGIFRNRHNIQVKTSTYCISGYKRIPRPKPYFFPTSIKEISMRKPKVIAIWIAVLILAFIGGYITSDINVFLYIAWNIFCFVVGWNMSRIVDFFVPNE